MFYCANELLDKYLTQSKVTLNEILSLLDQLMPDPDPQKVLMKAKLKSMFDVFMCY